ncbi:S-layer homology domain-containing protein [Pelosinus fermentans]|uniref:S-layer domain-containing protein n=1 Tax=Pelosinus fermentans JBW45 TaxID=1192197 RepID=I8U2C4_9FIRM|nr:S-layer domain-containing protein [Pelosinus fermentans JBW45]
MKKKLVASLAAAMILGVAGTSFAAVVNPFSDVPAKHWSYGAVTKLAHDGILDGYGDGTFRGDKTISRYEMAIIVAKAMSKVDQADASNKVLIEKLSNEYASELDKLGARMTTVESKIDNVKWNGFVRAKYDSDTSDGHNINGGNKHYFLRLDGSAKINDNWQGYWASETRHDYTSNGWSKLGENQDNTNDGDGAWFRIWAQGKVGAVGVTAGRAWIGYADNAVWGHEATGIWLDVPTGKFKTSVFAAKPTQGNGAITLDDATNTNIYGINFNTDISKKLNINLLVGGNEKHERTINTAGHYEDKDGSPHWVDPETTVVKQQMGSWGGVTLTAKLTQDLKLTGTYAKTDADDFNKTHHIRLDYKGADLNKPGSYGIYARFFRFGANGDPSHDDEWDSMRRDSRGWIVGVDYAVAKNVQWTNFYSDQKVLISDSAKEYNRKLIRTQFDLHF